MGDSASFRYGRTAASGGLEFAPTRKTSRFAQYTTQFNQLPQTRPASPPVQQAQQPSIPPATYMQQQVSYVGTQPTPEQYAPQQPVVQQPMYEQPLQQDNYANMQQEAPMLASAVAYEPQEEVNLQGISLDENEETHIRKFPASTIVRPGLNDGKAQKSKLRTTFKLLGTTFAIAVLGVSTWFLMGNRPAITASIRSKANFTVYDIALNSKFKVDRSTVETGQNNNIVYTVKQKDNNAKFIISQQAVPDVIKSDTQFQQFLNETDSYAVMDTQIGKAYFTKPANIGSDISVVVKNESTLMFIRGPGDTSEQDWSSLLATFKK